MKRIKSKIAATLALAAVFAFMTGCPNPSTTENNTDPEATLAQQVVNELGSALAAAPAASIRAVGSDQIAAIKAAASARIASDGLAASQELDKILPSMIAGAAAGTQNLDNASKAGVFEISAKSALESMGKTERKTKLSSGKTLSDAVGSVSEASVNAVVASLPPAEAVASLKAVSKVTITVVYANTVLSAVADAAVTVSVTKSVAVLESNSKVKAVGSSSDVSMKDAVAGILEGSMSAAAAKGTLVSVSTSINTALAATAMAKISAADMVSVSVSASIISSSSLSDSAKEAVLKASLAAALSGVSAGNADSLAKAAVQAVAGSDNASSALVVIAASQITATVKVNASVEITSAAMTAAVGETDSALAAEAGAGITKAVEDVLTETAPFVSVSASPSKLTKAGTVTLFADITAAADTEILWTQFSGPSVAISNAATASASVSITEAGNYSFSVTVKNKTGYLSASKTVNVGFEIPVGTDAAELLNAGIAALVDKDFDLALTKFEAAYQKDASNSQTTFWYAFMSLVSISTDPSTVTLMRDRIGVASYPDAMNDLFSDKWFNAKYYNTYWGFAPAASDDDEWLVRGDFVETTDYNTGSWVSCYDSDMNYTGGFGTFTPNAQGSYYASYFTYNGTQYSDYSNPYPYNAALCYVRSDILDAANFEFLPALQTPEWASNVYDSFGNIGETSTQIAISSYPKLLLLNLISRNARGFNDLLDSVLAGMYGERFNRVVSLIDSLPDSASITLPPDLIEAFTPDFSVDIKFPSPVLEDPYSAGNARNLTGDSTDASGEMPEFSIRKAELKALSATMQMNKSLIQLLSSYNLDYSIAFMQNEFWSDGGAKALAALYKQENPIAAGLLGNRSEAARSASKNTFLDAMDDFSDSLTLFAADVQDQTTLSGMLLAMTAPESVEMAVSYLGDAKVLVGKMRTSVSSGGTLYINPSALDGGYVTDLLSTSSSAGALECIPSALWSTDILNPAKLFETTGTAAAPEGLKFYGITVDAAGTASFSDVNAESKYNAVALKIKLDRIEELFTVPESMLPEDGYSKTENTIMFPIITMWDEPEQLSADQLALIEWMK